MRSPHFAYIAGCGENVKRIFVKFCKQRFASGAASQPAGWPGFYFAHRETPGDTRERVGREHVYVRKRQKGRYTMAKHKWEEPFKYGKYMESLANPKTPEFELVEEVYTGTGSYNGAGHAWIVHDKANDVTCLQSYYTIVSVVMGNVIRHLDKWSKTTSRHQCRFACQLGLPAAW